MANLFNLARCYVSSTGTGALTVGSAVPGYLSFASAGATAGMTLSYAIRDGANSEIGHGVYDGTTLTRNVTKSTSSDSPINVTSNAQIFLTPTAEDMSGAVGAWRFWKFRNLVASDPSAAFSLASVQLRASVGGSGQTPSAITISSGSGDSISSTWTPLPYSTGVQSGFGGGTYTLGDSDPWVLYDMGTAKSVAEIYLNAKVASSDRSYLTSFEVWVSNDNATWFLVSGFDVGSNTTFRIPSVVLGGMAINTSGGNSGGSGATALSGLSDVNVTEGSGINGYTLNWNNSTGKWVATAPVTGGSGGGATALTGLSDVNVVEGSSINKNVLAYDNSTSKWKSATALGVVIGDGSHRYWKVVLHNPGAFLGLSEMKLEVTTGAGTPSDVTYSSDSTPTAPPQWYDGDETHYAECSNPGTTNSVTADVIFTFTTAHIISNLRLHTAQSFGLDVPDSYAVYYSDNGTTWTLAASASLSGLALDTTYNYTVPLTITPATLINIGLPDFPTSYSGKALQVLRVNSTANAVEFHAVALSDLADVNVSEGAGIDGLFLKWNNSTSKWVAAAAGGGGGGTGVPANMENGPYMPPSAAWFDTTTAKASNLTTVLTDVSGKGLGVMVTGVNANDQCSCLLRPTSGWGTSWTVQGRIVHGDRGGNYPTIGLVVYDSTTGKLIICGSQANNPSFNAMVQRRNSITSYNSNTKDISVNDVPYWYKIALASGNLTYSFSWDGVNWFDYTESATAFLGASPSHAGLCFVGGNNTIPWGVGGRVCGLITYYSDPDHNTGALNLQAA